MPFSAHVSSSFLTLVSCFGSVMCGTLFVYFRYWLSHFTDCCDDKFAKNAAAGGVVRRWPIKFSLYLKTGFCTYFFNRRDEMNHLLSGMKNI